MTKKNILIMILVSTCGSLITGCASQRIDLVETGRVTIENRPTDKIKVLWSQAYEQEGSLVVHGILKRCDQAPVSIPVHVHVLLLSAEGKRIDSARSPNLSIPRDRIGRGYDSQRFIVRFANMPADPSKLHIVVHITLNEPEDDNDLI